MKLSNVIFALSATAAAAFAPSASFVSRGTPLFAEVTVALIKELRENTGAGMMNCKRALLDTDGDMEAATENLRAKGLATADKKATRIAAEGKIVYASAGNKGVMVEINCETDFVAMDSNFLGFADTVVKAALDIDGDDIESLLATEVEGESLEETRQALVSKIGENIQVRRSVSRGTDGSTVGCYIHLDSIGVMVELEGGSEELATDIAMHVAAMNPPYAVPEDVPEEVLEKEKRFLTQQAMDSGKPKEIAEKMVAGRIRKYLEDICLVSQTYIKTNDITVQKLLDNNDAKIKGFSRIVVGEGIEKRQDDFAAEVAKMTGKSE